MAFFSDSKGFIAVWIRAEKATCFKPMISYPLITKVARVGHFANSSIGMNAMGVYHMASVSRIIPFVKVGVPISIVHGAVFAKSGVILFRLFAVDKLVFNFTSSNLRVIYPVFIVDVFLVYVVVIAMIDHVVDSESVGLIVELELL